MTAVLAKKVAVRQELTGVASQDRAQRMAQQVGQAHELTKAVVTALANSTFERLTTDVTIATSASYATLLTATIDTTLTSGNLDISFSASGQKITNNGSALFRILVDGVAARGMATTCAAVTSSWAMSLVDQVAVTKGPHTVLLQWRTDTSSLRILAASTAEHHACLRVQEMP